MKLTTKNRCSQFTCDTIQAMHAPLTYAGKITRRPVSPFAMDCGWFKKGRRDHESLEWCREKI